MSDYPDRLEEAITKFEQSNEVIELAEVTGNYVDILSKWLAVATDTDKIDDTLVCVGMLADLIKEG